MACAIIPYPIIWWPASNTAQREAVLDDAAEKIERYGVPWVESPACAQAVGDAGAAGPTSSLEAVQAVMAPEMAASGLSP